MGLKHRKGNVLILIIVIIVVGTAIALSFFDVFGNRGTFLKGTTVNGVDVSHMTAAEAKKTIEKVVDQYQLTVIFEDGKETYSAKDLGLTLQTGSKLKKLIQEQSDAAGDGSVAMKPDLKLTAKDLIVCEADDLDQQVKKLPELTSRREKKSKNACLHYDADRGKFTIEPETVGGTIQASDLVNAIEKKAGMLQEKLNAATYGLYDGKAVRTKNSAKMKSALAKAKQKLNLSLTYTYDVKRADIHGKEEIGRALLSKWLYVDQDGVTASINGDRLQEYVTKMYHTYSVKNTGTSKFVTSIGTYVDVNVPAADETVDTNELYNDIVRCVNKGHSGKRKAPYASTSAGIKGTTDLGGTYVEVDLNHQHLYLYVDGKRIAEGNICSGCVADAAATPDGLYTIKSKDHDRYLRGNGYCDWVNYFMPFNGDIGLHDSTWRSKKEYGGHVYLDEGSHGCINLPLKLAKKIDQNVKVGTYVILYGGAPNPTKSVQSIYGTTYYTKRRGAGSFTLGAYTTGDGNLSYSSSDSNVVTVNRYGTVTVVGTGTATITVTASRTAQYARGTKMITVNVIGASSSTQTGNQNPAQTNKQTAVGNRSKNGSGSGQSKTDPSSKKE